MRRTACSCVLVCATCVCDVTNALLKGVKAPSRIFVCFDALPRVAAISASRARAIAQPPAHVRALSLVVHLVGWCGGFIMRGMRLILPRRAATAARHRTLKLMAQPTPSSHPHLMAVGEVTPGISSGRVRQPPGHWSRCCQKAHLHSFLRHQFLTCRTMCHFRFTRIPI